jgi:hypothetical protein
METTYKSDRIKIWRDNVGYGYSISKKKFGVFTLWYRGGQPFESEDKALTYASHVWFLHNVVIGKNSTRVVAKDEVIENAPNLVDFTSSKSVTTKYRAQRRFLKYFWLNISNKVHDGKDAAQREANAYTFKDEIDLITESQTKFL